MRTFAIVTTVGLGIALLASTACSSEPDWMGGSLPPTTSPASTDPKDEGGCKDGGAAGLGLDIATLKACCEDKGKAHCVPDNKVSETSRAKLTKCESGGVCLWDPIIEGKPTKACEAANGLGPGVCLSPCIKSVGDNAGSLKQQTCEAGELCAPCNYPGGGGPTGACAIGKSGSSSNDCIKDAAPAGDAGASGAGGGATCCSDKGQCLPQEAVPAERREQLEPKECGTGKLCAPKENIPSSFKPPPCKGTAITGSYDGVCLSNCISFGFFQKVASDQGSCDDDHRCMPCVMPITGKPTGAPGC